MLNNQIIDRILQTCCVERIVSQVMKQAVKTARLDIKIACRLSDEAELQIESDLQFRLKSDPAAHSASFILQGRDTAFYSVMCYRLTHLFWLQQYERIQIFALRLANYAKVNFNTDIHPAANICAAIKVAAKLPKKCVVSTISQDGGRNYPDSIFV